MIVEKLDSQKTREAATAEGAWEPCFVDPWRGVAHFDGITIEADPITSARPDRVLPCIADEQVFFCRMLRKRIGPQARGRAIDIGTGSGVLAIVAACLGLEVIGIDSSERALEFARFNQRSNPQVDSASLQFRVADVGDTTDPALAAGAYDYVLVNPPFAPVPSDFNAPHCVSAGEDGQKFFHDLLPLAWRLLKPGGSLFAIHLLLTNEDGDPVQLRARLLKDDWDLLDVAPAIATTRSLNDFRAATWPMASHESSEAVHATSNHLCLAFLEIRKSIRPGRHELEVVVRRSAGPFAWNDRERLHRAVLSSSPRLSTQEGAQGTRGSSPDSRASPSLFPAGTYFLEHSSPYTGEDSIEVPAGGRSSVHLAIARWISGNELLRPGDSSATAPSDHGFDLIMIEAAPWYLSDAKGNLNLESSTLLITHPDRHRADSSRRALTEILRQIKTINTQDRAVFRHPALQDRWTGIWQPSVGRHLLHPRFSIIRGPAVQQGDEGDEERQFEVCAAKGAQVTLRNNRLEKFEVPPRNTTTKSLDVCLEWALSDYTQIMVANGLLSDQQITWFIAAIPIPATQPNEQEESGFVYAYAWSTRGWSPQAETQLSDLAKAAALMYGDQFISTAKTRIRDFVLSDAKSVARHNLSKIVGLVQGGIDDRVASAIRKSLDVHLLISDGELSEVGPASVMKLRDNLERTARALFWDCYFIWKLWRFGTLKLDDEKIDRWQKEAADVFSVQSLDSIPERLREALQTLRLQEGEVRVALRAAVTVALSNAIVHATKPECKDARISFSVTEHNGFPSILITTSYVSTLEYVEQSKESLRTKVAKAEGTARDLKYHCSTYLDLDRFSEAAFIRCDDQRVDQMQSRAAWHSWIPLPISRNVQASMG